MSMSVCSHTSSTVGPHLAPNQHGAKDHLESVEEVISDDDDGGSAGRPALAGTDGFNAGRGCFGKQDNKLKVTLTKRVCE